MSGSAKAKMLMKKRSMRDYRQDTSATSNREQKMGIKEGRSSRDAQFPYVPAVYRDQRQTKSKKRQQPTIVEI